MTSGDQLDDAFKRMLHTWVQTDDLALCLMPVGFMVESQNLNTQAFHLR